MIIEFDVPKNIPSNQWQNWVLKKSHEIAKQENYDWKSTGFFVRLPEEGRFMIKSANYITFSSYG